MIERQLVPDPDALSSYFASEAAASFSRLNPLQPATTTISSRVAAFTTTKLVTKVETFRQGGDLTHVRVTTEVLSTPTAVATTLVTSGASSVSDWLVGFLNNYKVHSLASNMILFVATLSTWVFGPYLVDAVFRYVDRRRVRLALHGPAPAF